MTPKCCEKWQMASWEYSARRRLRAKRPEFFLKMNLTKQLTTTGNWNMSANRNYGIHGIVTSASKRVGPRNDSIRVAIQHAKEALLFEHVNGAGEHGRLLRLALNEAEGLAWQTEF